MGNDSVLLNSILEHERANTSLSKSDYFEVFTFAQVLKHHDLSDEELLNGRVGGGDDGGIDGFFELINGFLVSEDTPSKQQFGSAAPAIELHLVQSKQSPSFSETALDKVIATARLAFDLSVSSEVFPSLYNRTLANKILKFREDYLDLASCHPRLRVCVYYATTADTVQIHPKVSAKVDLLRATLQELLAGADVAVRLVGARALIDLSREAKTGTLRLDCVELISRGGPNDNYVVLATLSDYHKFISEDGRLRREIFESNVRDFQGNVAVNQQIAETLRSGDPGLDFWWLNNGITVLTSAATLTGKTLSLSDVQVVNGLQTTESIYRYVQARESKEPDQRTVLIRVIRTSDKNVRDRIIWATNNQTRLAPSSLRAMEGFQRDLEDYFLVRDWYYDRRKNFYRNTEKKPPSRIVSITFLAQAVMAIVLLKPDSARARPSTLIRKDADYKKVFDPALKPDVYLFCARTLRAIDGFLARIEDTPYARYVMSNLRFHAAAIWAIRLSGSACSNPRAIERICEAEIDLASFMAALTEAQGLYGAFRRPLLNHGIRTESSSPAISAISFLKRCRENS